LPITTSSSCKTIALDAIRNAVFEARRLGCTDADIAKEVKLSESKEVWPDLTDTIPTIDIAKLQK
jgi:hypothetical protein